MIVVCTLSDAEAFAYRRELTGEKLGWVIFKHPASFVPVHRVLMHPEDGPIVIIDNEVLEVDPEACRLFADEESAREAYYAG